MSFWEWRTSHYSKPELNQLVNWLIINLPFVQSKPLWIQGDWKNKKGIHSMIKKWCCIETVHPLIWFEENHLVMTTYVSGATPHFLASQRWVKQSLFKHLSIWSMKQVKRMTTSVSGEERRAREMNRSVPGRQVHGILFIAEGTVFVK